MTDTHFSAPSPDTDFPERPDNGEAVYDALRAELAKPVAVEPLALAVPQRPTVEVLFSPAIEWDLFDSWMKRAAKNKDKRINPMTVANQVLTHCCVGIRVGGKEVVGDEGPITFMSRELWQMVGAVSPTECIKKLYGVDGHIIQTSGSVLDAAGYGEVDLEGEDSNPL